MKSLLASFFIVVAFASTAQTTKSILLTQLTKTHSEKDWFVPVNIAVAGLTAEQAGWKDGSGNHSIAELTHHLIFWNERQLSKFKEQRVPDFDGSNDETFNQPGQAKWNTMPDKLDAILNEWEKAIENSNEAKLKDWYSTIALISTHNAYHTGQIIFIRKLQGSWDANKGVK